MFDNIILNTDSYKVSMATQYPPGTEYVYSYIEPRGGKWDHVLMFGLQMFLKTYMTKPITQEMVDEAAEVFAAHGEPFFREGWEYIVNAHAGRLPVLIKAVREGTVLPNRNVLLTIVNTDPKCFWLTTYLETALLRAVWYGTTVATNSWQAKQVIRHYLDLSSDDPEGQIAFKLHDFGARGVSSLESAAIGGAAHLVNFMGTDTVSGLMAARKYYGADMAGFSIPAAEHSTITSWGRKGEVDAYRNMLRQFARPGSIVAVVSDSYDLFGAIDNIWGTELRQHVIDSGATLVVRPDSGDPTLIPIQAVERLAAKFGTTTNAKGYKVLNHVRVIQGDGINADTIKIICERLLAAGYSLDNLGFGMGGGLLQQLDRDTLKFAMKCSAIRVNGEWREVVKDPITDPGKRSKAGRLALVSEGGYQTVPYEDAQWKDELIAVYRNGEILREMTFDEIRKRSNRPLIVPVAKAA
jgi:nicotinamide phosphoribosyltransferase